MRPRQTIHEALDGRGAVLINLSSLRPQALLSWLGELQVGEVIDYSQSIASRAKAPRRALLAALGAAPEGPRVVVLDSLHAADWWSLTALRALAGGGAMWLLDLAGRQAPLSVAGALRAVGWQGLARSVPLLGRASEALAARRRWRLLTPTPRVSERRALSRVLSLRGDLMPFIAAGGSVNHIGGVLAGLRANGVSVELVTSAAIPGIPDAEVVPVDTPRRGPGAAAAYELRLLDRLRGRGARPDAVYWRLSLGGLAGPLAARALDCPLIVEYNGSEVEVIEWGGARVADREACFDAEQRAFEEATLIICVSEPLAVELRARGVPEEKLLVLPNGVELARFEGLEEQRAGVRAELGFSDGDVVCGFVGTFGSWHGTEVLAAAIAPAVAAHPRLRFLLIGDGPERQSFEARITADGVADRVVLTGLVAQDQAPRLMSAFDLALSPHVPPDPGRRFIGSPTKLYEYMALGRGIVASRLEQQGRVLRHGETAWLVEPGDSADLCAGIITLAGDPELRAKLGVAARAEARAQHGWTARIARLLARWSELGEGSSARG